MKKLVLSTDDLPKDLDEEARFKLWRDMYSDSIGPFVASRLPVRPFGVKWEFMQFEQVRLARYAGTVQDLVRTPQQAAAAAIDCYEFSFVTGPTPYFRVQRDQEAVLTRGEATFQSSLEATSTRTAAPSSWIGVMIPRLALLDLVPVAEDLVAAPLDQNSPIVRHIQKYMGILFDPDGIEDDPALLKHVGATLVDLVALALGAQGDAAAIARMRGLRASRVRAILAAIQAGFTDPVFSPQSVAMKLGLSARYVHDLLQETGVSFSERVLELRLQKARSMLAHHRHDPMKISDIALACGFNEVSYFNRSFRRRFGASPTEYRNNRGE